MGAHIDKDGRFQSDKYPTCPAGKVPLSVNDKSAQDLLWTYAQRRRTVDAEFADDLEACLLAAGYNGGKRPFSPLGDGTEDPPTLYAVPPGAAVGGAPIPAGPATAAEVARTINADSGARAVATLSTPGTIALTPPAHGTGTMALPRMIADDEDDTYRIVAVDPFTFGGCLDIENGAAACQHPGAEHCMGCGDHAPTDAYDKGWRSQTGPGPDGSVFLCPDCRRHQEGPERGP